MYESYSFNYVGKITNKFWKNESFSHEKMHVDVEKCPCRRALLPHAVGQRVPIGMGIFLNKVAILFCFVCDSA